MKRIWLDFTVGVFVIIGVLALVFLVFRVGNLEGGHSSKESYAVTAGFENIGSVRVGSPVKSAGIVIGEVARITLNPKNYRAEVEMRISQSYLFPTDSEASVMTAGLLGEQYLDIAPGIEDKMLAQGDHLERTQSAMVLEKLIGQFMLSFANKKSD